jgi:transposase
LDILSDAIMNDDSWTLQLLVSRRNAIVKVRTALKNQVHSYITHHYSEYEIKNHMKQFPYKLETMPGIDTITAAMLISEIGDIKRFASADKLSRYSGISPVSCSSGDRDKDFRNKQGNRRLYEIFRNIASRSICKGRNKESPVNEIFPHATKQNITKIIAKHKYFLLIITTHPTNIIVFRKCLRYCIRVFWH